MKLCTCSELDVVCPVCLSRFARQLGDVPALLAELDVTAARLGRGGSLTGGRSKATEAPLPFHPEAADLAHELRWNLINGALQMLDDEGLFMHRAPWRPRPTVEQAIGFLLANLAWFGDRDGRGPAVIEWLAGQSAAARRMILGPAGRWYAGVCGAPLTEVELFVEFALVGDVLVPAVGVERGDGGRCDQRLFASTGAAVVRCKACEAEHPVADRRDRLVLSARESAMPIDVILSALPWLIGASVNKATARSWRRERKYRPAVRAWAGVEGVSGRQLRQAAQLYPVGVDVDGRELFRVGEVIDLAMAALARSKARNENRPLLAEASRGAGVYAPNDSSGVGLVWNA